MNGQNIHIAISQSTYIVAWSNKENLANYELNTYYSERVNWAFLKEVNFELYTLNEKLKVAIKKIEVKFSKLRKLTEAKK